jgi:hypothetical protein
MSGGMFIAKKKNTEEKSGPNDLFKDENSDSEEQPAKINEKNFQ